MRTIETWSNHACSEPGMASWFAIVASRAGSLSFCRYASIPWATLTHLSNSSTTSVVALTCSPLEQRRTGVTLIGEYERAGNR